MDRDVEGPRSPEFFRLLVIYTFIAICKAHIPVQNYVPFRLFLSENEAPIAAISRTKTPARKPRKSSVAKNDEDGEISIKTPAKTPGRRSTVKKAKSFADVKVIGGQLLARLTSNNSKMTSCFLGK